MRLKDYKRTMDSLKVPHASLKRAAESVQSAPVCDNVILCEENNHRKKYPWIAAVAAMLILAMGLSAEFVFNGKPASSTEKSNAFVITAGAAEINPDYYVEIGEMQRDGASSSTTYDKDDAGHYYYIEHSETQAFVLDQLRCFGEGIDYYTYTVSGGYMILDGKTGEVLTAICSDDPDAEPVLQLLPDGKNRFAMTDEEHRAFIAFGFTDDTGKYRDRLVQEIEGDEIELISEQGGIYQEMFAEHANELSMLITAHYQDGATLSKKLSFELVEKECFDAYGEEPRMQYYLTAKIEE